MARVTDIVQVFLLLIQVHFAISEIRVNPRDTEAVVGQLTYLNCSTSFPSWPKGIMWYHYPVGASDSNYIYLLGQLQRPYDERYRVETQSDAGTFNLVIQSVETGDAGKYVCQEEGEHGQHKIAELIVLDANPVCGSNMKEDGFVGSNSCDVKPEEIQLSCNIAFHGNVPPIVEWKEVGKGDTIGEGIQQEISARHVTSFLNISGHQSQIGSSFTCQTRRSTTKQNRCISDGVKVIYVFDALTSTQAVVGEEITCLANSSQHCTYKWKWSDDHDQRKEIISDRATITFSKPGSYICEAECQIRQKTCSVVAKLVQVSPVDSRSTSAEYMNRPITLVASTAAITALVTFIVGFVVQKWWNSRQRHLKGPTEENRQLLPGLGPTEEKQQWIPRLEIYGLTKLNEEVFISRYHSGEVEVYDSVQFAFQRSWQIQNLLNPTDLICNGNHLCLFDFKDLGQDSEIFTVTPKGELVNKWLTGSNNFWGTISASSDSHVLLTVYMANMLMEFSSDGKLLRQIVLTGADILNPWHAIKLADDEYVVCYGRYGLPQHRVCLVRLNDEDIEGGFNIGKDDVIKTFGGAKGSSPEEMDAPIRLEVGANGSIYVADHHNGRVLMLDSELKLMKEIASAEKHDLHHPRRMHLDEKNDSLLVSGYFRVLECQLSHNRAQWFDINPGD